MVIFFIVIKRDYYQLIMKINKFYKKALNKAKEKNKIKKWENYSRAIEIHYNDGTVELCKNKAEIETSLTQLFAYQE